MPVRTIVAVVLLSISAPTRAAADKLCLIGFIQTLGTTAAAR
jgi:hypothetical protein